MTPVNQNTAKEGFEKVEMLRKAGLTKEADLLEKLLAPMITAATGSQNLTK